MTSSTAELEHEMRPQLGRAIRGRPAEPSRGSVPGPFRGGRPLVSMCPLAPLNTTPVPAPPGAATCRWARCGARAASPPSPNLFCFGLGFGGSAARAAVRACAAALPARRGEARPEMAGVEMASLSSRTCSSWLGLG